MKLNLENNQFGTASAEFLARSLQCTTCTLQSLFLAGNSALISSSLIGALPKHLQHAFTLSKQEQGQQVVFSSK